MSGTTGYILNGKYVRASDVPAGVKVPRKQILHAKQMVEDDAKQFARDLVQPYVNGKPNPEFIDAMPQAAERYGFVDKEDRNT